jgi:hypothetical protein
MQRLRQWCEDVSRAQSGVKHDSVYVDQESFDKYKRASFRRLTDGFREYKENPWDLVEDPAKVVKSINDLRPGGGTAHYDAIFYACRDKLSVDSFAFEGACATTFPTSPDSSNPSHETPRRARETAAPADKAGRPPTCL